MKLKSILKQKSLVPPSVPIHTPVKTKETNKNETGCIHSCINKAKIFKYIWCR
jgi:hypothetical protein